MQAMDAGRTDQASWFWIGKYLVVIVAALVLGSTLAALEPFRSAEIGSAHIGAGALVRFIAHCGALSLLWALGFRHSRQLRGVSGPSRHLADTVLALITLIVVASAYGVLLHFIAPMLAADVKPFIDWLFIVGILAAALWLLWVLFTDSEKVIEAVGSLSAARKQTARPLVDQVRS
jgi:eukaryotic-like serine/threonine-protein kinase